MVDALYDDDNERAKHHNTIHILAQQSGKPEEEVIVLYEAELRRAKESARIMDFLPILIGRKVRDKLEGEDQALE